MHPADLLAYCFFFGLLHGILPDEHTWPITFSYAIGGASGREGMKAGFYFSAAFTVQRMIISQLSSVALSPFLLSQAFQGGLYVIVGAVMTAAGGLVLRTNRYPHVHLLGERNLGAILDRILPRQGAPAGRGPVALPARWAAAHGFIAGFGFGGFSLYVNTVAAPAMPNPWLGFLPGLAFGLGTMIMLIVVSGLFGAALRLSPSLTAGEVRQVGALTGGSTLFFGGLLFAGIGALVLSGAARYFPLGVGTLTIGLFLVIVVIPSVLVALRQVTAARKQSGGKQRDGADEA